MCLGTDDCDIVDVAATTESLEAIEKKELAQADVRVFVAAIDFPLGFDVQSCQRVGCGSAQEGIDT